MRLNNIKRMKKKWSRVSEAIFSRFISGWPGHENHTECNGNIQEGFLYRYLKRTAMVGGTIEDTIGLLCNSDTSNEMYIIYEYTNSFFFAFEWRTAATGFPFIVRQVPFLYCCIGVRFFFLLF